MNLKSVRPLLIMLVVFLAVGSVNICLAQEYTFGVTEPLFLGAEAMAMGGAYSAMGGMDAPFWNVAGLKMVTKPAVTYNYVNQGLIGSQTAVFSFVIPSNYNGATLGFTMAKISDEDIEAGFQSSTYLLSYAKEAFRGINYGINLKINSGSLAGEKYNALGFDGGLLWTAKKLPLTFGVSWKNIKTSYVGQTSQVIKPVEVYACALKPNNRLIFSLEHEKGFGNRYGFQWSLSNTLALRLGNNNGKPTYGLEFSPKNKALVFSFAQTLDDIGSRYQMATKYSF